MSYGTLHDVSLKLNFLQENRIKEDKVDECLDDLSPVPRYFLEFQTRP